MWYKRQKVYFPHGGGGICLNLTLLPSVFSLYSATYFKTNYKLCFSKIQEKHFCALLWVLYIGNRGGKINIL